MNNQDGAIGAPARTASNRDTWVDVAKGIAIILVVLFHAVIFTHDAGVVSGWSTVSGMLDTFRMPLFFFTAGLFAAKTLRMPFGQMYRHRVASLLWLYGLWSVLWAVAFAFIPSVRLDSSDLPVWARIAIIPVWPNESTWFVYALALFFLAAWVMRRFPVWVQLVPGLVLTLLFGSNFVNSGNGSIDKAATYLLFFVAAVHLGPWVRRFVPKIGGVSTAALVVAYVLMAIPAVKFDLMTVPGVRLVVSAVAVATGLAVARMLSQLSFMDWLRYLGTRTLPIYFLHFYPVLLVSVVILRSGVTISGVTAILVPPGLTVVAIVIALAFHRCTLSVPGLYALPRFRPGTSKDADGRPGSVVSSAADPARTSKQA